MNTKSINMKDSRGLYIFTQAFVVFVLIMISSVLIMRYNQYYYTETGTELFIEFNTDINIDTFTTELIDLSKDHGVNICQISEITEELLFVYASNISSDERFSNLSSDNLGDSRYYSNRRVTSNLNVGVVKKLFSQKEIRIYSFSDVKNVGISNNLYYLGNKTQLDNVIASLKSFGDVTIIAPNIFESIVGSIEFTTYIPASILLILCLLLANIVVSVTYIISLEKLIKLCIIHGKSRVETIFEVLYRLLNSSILVITFISFTISVVFISIYNLQLAYFGLSKLFIVYLVYVLGTIIFILLLSNAQIKSLSKRNNIIIRNTNSYHIFTTLIVKIVSTILLIAVITNIIIDSSSVIEKHEKYELWEQYQNIYKVNLSSNAIRYSNNLTKERGFNDRCSEFYKIIKSNNDAFIINSMNFVPMKSNSKGDYYLYEDMMLNKNDFYSPYGYSVIVDDSYLELNQIKDLNGNIVVNSLEKDSNTINVLVPEKYQDKVEQVYNNYLDYFYFQKVEVANIYNEAMNQPSNNQQKDELKVNIIITASNQDYFTYSSYTGDSNNKILDPFVLVYSDVLDSSNIMANLSTSVYFISNSHGSAYLDIVPALIRTQLTDVDSVESIYTSVGKDIKKISTTLLFNTILLLLAVLVTMVIIGIFAKQYYNKNKRKLTLKFLTGASLIELKQIIAILASNILILYPCLYIYDISLALMIVFTLVIFECITVIILTKNITKEKMSQIVKE